MKKLLIFLLCCCAKQLFSQPIITSFSPASGPAGTSVIISGSGFSNNPTSNIIFFGATRGTVTTASSTSVSVIVPAAASFQPITITVGGRSAFSRKPFSVTFPGGGVVTSSSFAPRQDINMNPAVTAAHASKDLDNDGKPDIILSTILPNNGPDSYGFSVFKNISTPGNISLSSAIYLPTPITSAYVTVADMDGDGKPDIVAPLLPRSNEPNAAVAVFKNSSAGGNISFAGSTNFPSGGGYGVTVADFDGDGMPDFATTNNEGSGYVSVNRNTSFSGILSFAPYLNFAAGYTPRGVAAGYIDDDNKPDLVIANQYGSTFSLLINTSTPGNISFASRVDFQTTPGSNCEGIAIGDFDGDDKADVAVTNNNNGMGTISVFRNIGSGGNIDFAPKVDLLTGPGWQPFGLSLSDIDGNGKPEIIVSYGYGGSNTISIFRNKSTVGVFSFESNLDLVTRNPSNREFDVGDIDGDSKPDIYVGSNYNAFVSFFRNTIESPNIVSFTPLAACADSTITINGTNFTGATAVRFGGTAAASFSVISANVITAIPGPNATGIISISTPLGTGTGSGFTNTGSCALPPQITSFSPSKGQAGISVTIKGKNFNAVLLNNIVYFGAVKAIITSSTDTTLIVTVPNGATNKPLTVTSNNRTAYALKPFNTTFNSDNLCDVFSTGSFAHKLDFGTGASPYANSLIDLDGDQKPDVVTADFSSNNVSILRNIGGAGTVAFGAPVNGTTGTQPVSCAYGDIDGDGKLDLAVVNYSSNSVSVFMNTSSGINVSYSTAATFSVGANPRGIYIGDLDMDGKPDLIVSNFSGNTISVLRNTSSGTSATSFASQITFATGNGPSGIFVLDIDNDKLPDILLANTQSNTLSVLKNAGTGSGNIAFDAKIDFATGNQPLSLFADDLDNDGKPDIVVANYSSSTISLLQNTSTLGTVSFAPKLDYTTSLGPVSIAIADLNGDGRPDIATANVFDGNISILKNVSTAGSMGFAPKMDYNTGNSPRSISVGDIDGDAKPDILAANYDDNTISVLRNNIGFISGQLCIRGSNVFISDLTGTSFQWQQNIDGGFANISDNSNFSGTHTNSLQLNTPPSAWYGYQYRCMVDGGYSSIINLTFINNFTGAVDTSWENPGNWSCNQLPDANTDVTISCTNNVVLSLNGVCRSLNSKQGASVLVKAGVKLTITH